VDRADVARLGRSLLTHEGILLSFLAGELVVFGFWSSNFLSLDNAREIVRASVEVGLLAVALTPVIITGGIDLSVGSLLGLAAVVMGAAWRASWPMALAAGLAVVVGLAGGAMNAILIAGLRIPPLIVTLGTYSLFRGLAEGLTGGIQNYSNFPPGFLFLGQGAIAGAPVQLYVFLAASFLVWMLQHRMAVGRTLRAMGYSFEGARYAGIAVGGRLGLVYVLSGLAAGLASLVYVARLGQAKADAGTGFELTAIAAVVLGGTSIFGGSGSVPGTLLGLAALSVLQNGLRLADLPAELAGILTGALLVGALGANRLFLEGKAA